MKEIYLKAPAKINLFLDIKGKESNGYHNLSSVMQSLDLFDYISIKIDESSECEEISVICDKLDIPQETNIAYKAARLFLDTLGITGKIEININKNIPSKAGLGGGSSDAAAVLFGLNILFNTNLDIYSLSAMASELGSDVPFFLLGGTRVCSGTGTEIEECPQFPYDAWIVLVKPDFGYDTAGAYENYDIAGIKPVSKCSIEEFSNLLESSVISEISTFLFNAFDSVNNDENIQRIKNRLIELGSTGAIMTGSGSCVFGLFDDEEKAVSAWNSMKNEYGFSSINRPYSTGISLDNSAKVYNKLNSLNIPFSRTDHPSVYTMEEMDSLGIFDKGIVGKNLFIRDSKGKRHFLIFVYGDKKVSLSNIEEKLGIKHVSFGSPERLMSHLGLLKGSVSPMGLVNNTDSDVEMLIDRDFVGCKSIGVHPNQNTSTIWISYEDLVKFIEDNGNSMKLIEI